MTDQTHPHGGGTLLQAGAQLQDADKVLILLHGRGASAADIIRLGPSLTEKETGNVTYLAPQAVNNTWYPASGFLPQDQLAPWLDSALRVIDETIETVTNAGVPASKIVLGGFSQGAMLSLEYASRGRKELGGIIAFSGSLIGPVDEPHADVTPVDGLPMFIGCGTNDSWIPARAAEKSAEMFTAAGAKVDLRIYEGLDHTIIKDEIEGAASLIAGI